MSLDDTLVARALQCPGLSYGNPATRAAYLALHYPGDTPKDAAEMGAKQSACMLFVRGLLAGDETDGMITYRGKLVDILRGPYAAYVGQIGPMLSTLGQQKKIITSEQAAFSDVQPADMIVIGQGGSAPQDAAAKAAWLRDWGGLEHALFVTGFDGDVVESVDGGQTDPQNASRSTAVATRRRTLIKRNGVLWLADDSGAARRIGWRLRCGALPVREAA